MRLWMDSSGYQSSPLPSFQPQKNPEREGWGDKGTYAKLITWISGVYMLLVLLLRLSNLTPAPATPYSSLFHFREHS